MLDRFTFLRALGPRWRQRGAVVLTYHSVAEAEPDPYGQRVSPAAFEEQLIALREMADIVSAASLVKRIKEGLPIDGLAAITFDDGYADNLHAALPIAERLDVPITVFITTEPVSRQEPFWWEKLPAMLLSAGADLPARILVSGEAYPLDSEQARKETLVRLHAMLRIRAAEDQTSLMEEIEAQMRPGQLDLGHVRPLDTSELRTLAAHPLVEIGAHTKTHPSLAALPAADQDSELRGSRRALEAMLGRSVPLLSYPFGKRDNVSRSTRKIARHIGFEAAFTTVPHAAQRHADPMAIPRVTVHQWPIDFFESRIGQLLS